MSSRWPAIDELIRELGFVRSAAESLRASDMTRAVVERAIADAAEAVRRTIDSRRDPETLMRARDAVGIAAEVIRSLDAEIGRSLRIGERAAHLRDRASELIRNAAVIADRQGVLRRAGGARRRIE